MKRSVALSVLLLAFVAGRPAEASTFTLSSLDCRICGTPILVSCCPTPTFGSETSCSTARVRRKSRSCSASERPRRPSTSTTSAQYAISVGLALQPTLAVQRFGCRRDAERRGSATRLATSLWDNPITLAFRPAGAGLLQITLVECRVRASWRLDVYGDVQASQRCADRQVEFQSPARWPCSGLVPQRWRFVAAASSSELTPSKIWPAGADASSGHYCLRRRLHSPFRTVRARSV